MPKTNAEHCREYRRKKRGNKIKKKPKSSTQRVREFRARRKALLNAENNSCNTHNDEFTVKNNESDHIMEEFCIIPDNDEDEENAISIQQLKILNEPPTRKRRFSVVQGCPEGFSSQSSFKHDIDIQFQLASISGVLQNILEGLTRLESQQENLSKRMFVLENVLMVKEPENENEDMTAELQNLIPITTEHALQTVEKLLDEPVYVTAMTNIVIRLKSIRMSIERVLHSLLSDALVNDYNCDGKAGKKALINLKIMEVVCDVFKTTRSEMITSIRRFVVLSHNRHKQNHYRIRTQGFKNIYRKNSKLVAYQSSGQ